MIIRRKPTQQTLENIVRTIDEIEKLKEKERTWIL